MLDSSMLVGSATFLCTQDHTLQEKKAKKKEKKLQKKAAKEAKKDRLGR